MKYEIRWWTTSKLVNKTEHGYNQEKVDRAGETKVNTQAARDSMVETLLRYEECDYMEIKILCLKEESE